MRRMRRVVDRCCWMDLCFAPLGFIFFGLCFYCFFLVIFFMGKQQKLDVFRVKKGVWVHVV